MLNLSLWKQADTKTEELKMKKENTLQEVQEQIFELQEEREKCDVKLKQLQNQGKKLEKLANEKERKRRNHRLIQRGLIVERVIKNPLIFTNEEIEEQIKSFIVAGITTLVVMFVISRIAPNLSLNILIRYYDYKLFLGFSIVVYAINLLIFNFSLKRILDKPTIDLIRTI